MVEYKLILFLKLIKLMIYFKLITLEKVSIKIYPSLFKYLLIMVHWSFQNSIIVYNQFLFDLKDYLKLILLHPKIKMVNNI